MQSSKVDGNILLCRGPLACVTHRKCEDCPSGWAAPFPSCWLSQEGKKCCFASSKCLFFFKERFAIYCIQSVRNTKDLIFIQVTQAMESNVWYYTSLEPSSSCADSVALLSSQAAGLLLCGDSDPEDARDPFTRDAWSFRTIQFSLPAF